MGTDRRKVADLGLVNCIAKPPRQLEEVLSPIMRPMKFGELERALKVRFRRMAVVDYDETWPCLFIVLFLNT